MRVLIYIFFAVASSLFLLNFFDRNPAINLTTKTCVVTGASSGIGREIALQMLKQGWTVIAIARRTHLLQELKQHTANDKLIAIQCDTSNLNQVEATCKQLREQNLYPTLFFLNAGIGESERSFDPLIPINKKTFATNYFGALAWIDAWLPFLNKFGGGTFVATASVLALLATPGTSAYSASKAAVTHCFDSLRRQYLHQNIGFCAAFCGPVETAMQKEQLPFTHSPEDEASYIIDQVFAGKKNIYPSWIYASALKLLSLLPDRAIVRLTDIKTAQS